MTGEAGDLMPLVVGRSVAAIEELAYATDVPRTALGLAERASNETGAANDYGKESEDDADPEKTT
jgi:hypothetical protein